MWIIRLLLAWALLYVVFRWLLFGGKDDNTNPAGDGSGDSGIHNRTGYLSDAPDALRPDTEPDDFDPTDYM